MPNMMNLTNTIIAPVLISIISQVSQLHTNTEVSNIDPRIPPTAYISSIVITNNSGLSQPFIPRNATPPTPILKKNTSVLVYDNPASIIYTNTISERWLIHTISQTDQLRFTWNGTTQEVYSSKILSSNIVHQTLNWKEITE